jgi:hypothetical protein
MKNARSSLAALLLTVAMGLLAGWSTAADEPAKSSDAKKIAAAIDGYRFEFPCKGLMPENPRRARTAIRDWSRAIRKRRTTSPPRRSSAEPRGSDTR